MKTNVYLIISLFAFAMLISVSCKKDRPPKAVVTVVNAAGSPVMGATVKIYSDPSYYNQILVSGSDSSQLYPSVGYFDPDALILFDTKTTDVSGKTEHEFKYESIYNVRVTLPIKISHVAWDTLRGEGALILKMNDTYQETIILR